MAHVEAQAQAQAQRCGRRRASRHWRGGAGGSHASLSSDGRPWRLGRSGDNHGPRGRLKRWQRSCKRGAGVEVRVVATPLCHLPSGHRGRADLAAPLDGLDRPLMGSPGFSFFWLFALFSEADRKPPLSIFH